MSSGAARFVGDIPAHYDRDLGPIIFSGFAADIARRTASSSPARVLETAAGTGIVTRELRDRLPVAAHLTATDLNAPMLEVARDEVPAGRAGGVPPRRCHRPAVSPTLPSTPSSASSA